MNLRNLLASKIHQAMIAVGIPQQCQPHVTPSSRSEFGDYQANGAMAAAKLMKTNPRQLAQQLVDTANLHGIAERLEVAGPGFINIHIDPAWLGENVQQANRDPHLGVVTNPQPQTVVVDYSGPNLAKEMHVGHLRSTIIGDAMARILDFHGDKVIRQNHMGDWGTQFGMLIAHLEATLESPDTLPEVALADLEAFYRAAKKRFDDNPGFADKAREYVVKLQAGDPRCLQLWRQFITISIAHSEEIYRALNVSLQADDIRAESSYNPQLAEILSALQQQHLATTSAGAQVVFLEELADKEGKPQAVIVQKSDGGYLYATTDLAAARYRSQTLHADRILYFIDARQSLHMQQVFAISRKAGFVADNCQLEHHPFGTMMGEDGKPFKTRTGGTVKLAELLTEAVDRARHLLEQRETTLDEAEKTEVARKVGIGAVKYADLSKNRTSDYIFSWDAMLSFEGNTAPYLQYAYTRVQSIFRKGDINPEQLSGNVKMLEPQEKILALKLLQFAEVLDQITRDAYPSTLCAYLYELAGCYMRFYETCPVLQSGLPDGTRQSRLVLCDLTAKILRQGLELLGIEVMDRM